MNEDQILPANWIEDSLERVEKNAISEGQEQTRDARLVKFARECMRVHVYRFYLGNFLQE